MKIQHRYFKNIAFAPKIISRAPLIAALSLAILAGCGHDAVRYETARASQGRIVEYVTASGTLSAVVSVDVGSQVSGRISELDADFNSRVKKGQVVAEIDPTTYRADLLQAEGELAGAKADVLLKRENLKRKKILFPLKVASQSDLDQAVAEQAEAKATVIVKQAALQKARANLGYCKIIAPVDGMVITRKVDLGQTINAAMSTPVLFTIAQGISKMRIKADVSEADIGQVRDGQPVDFTVDAFADEIFHGTVTQVRKSATTSQNVVTYQTIISVANPGQKLFPGMTANVSILVAEKPNALRIPNAALRFSPPDKAVYEKTPPARLRRDQRLVYTIGADGLKLRPLIVNPGISDGVYTEISDGLKENTPVVISTISSGSKKASLGPPPQM
ncbi:MAG: efflux RND transporter periplasmic adaptor subunit [Syntrophobacteraceae bacterium]|nr:efflux RND transporter periplasmic adaptor subunit [Syntrophobacteraceae bacterium]